MADLLAELQQTPQPVNLLAELPAAPQPETAADVRPGLVPRVVGTLGSAVGLDFGKTARATEAGLISAGSGLTKVARGAERLTGVTPFDVGPVSSVEAQAMQQLEAEFPIATTVGEIAGESAPFLPGGLASVPAKLLPRLAATFGLGAAEGATIIAGGGGTGEDIARGAGIGGTFASAASLAIPVFGRVLGKTIRRLTGKNADEVLDAAGNINADVKKTLDEAGVTVEQLQDETVQIVRQATESPEGLARLKAGIESGEQLETTARATLFDDLGIPTTRSRIEQTPEAFLEERRLGRQVESDSAQELRERLAAESQGFKDVSDQLADDLGLGRDAGESIKTALDARRTGEKANVKALYDDLKVKSQGRGIPLAGDEVSKSLQDDDVRGLIGRLSESEIDGLNDRLIEFGIDSDPNRVANWVESRTARAGGLPTKTEVTPLNALNFNEFRKSLNSLLGPDSSDELRGVAGKIKEGLDNEINFLEKQLKSGDLGKTGQISLDAIEAAKRATKASALFKQEFGPDKIVNTLIKPKRGSFDEPQILASELVRKMQSPRDKIGTEEAIESITDSLRKGGAKGKQALGDFQSATVLDLMETATKAKSGKLDGGVIEWSGTNFGKKFDAIGERRLNAIFKDNQQAFNMLKKLRAAGDLKTEFKSVAKSSGTADDLINFFDRVPFVRNLFSTAGGLTVGPGALIAGEVAEGGIKKVKANSARKAVEKRLSTSPVLRQQAQNYRLMYPNILAVLGIESVTTKEEK
jgi:hypothetical protein